MLRRVTALSQLLRLCLNDIGEWKRRVRVRRRHREYMKLIFAFPETADFPVLPSPPGSPLSPGSPRIRINRTRPAPFGNVSKMSKRFTFPYFNEVTSLLLFRYTCNWQLELSSCVLRRYSFKNSIPHSLETHNSNYNNLSTRSFLSIVMHSGVPYISRSCSFPTITNTYALTSFELESANPTSISRLNFANRLYRNERTGCG